MGIESITFFEIKGKNCHVAYGYQGYDEKLLNNPLFIDVANILDYSEEGEVLYVENTHEDIRPENHDISQIGFWRIKYKF